jgi:hypothetical protein
MRSPSVRVWVFQFILQIRQLYDMSRRCRGISKLNMVGITPVLTQPISSDSEDRELSIHVYK